MIDVELLWDFGNSDKLCIIFLKRDSLNNLQICNCINGEAKPISFYVDYLKNLSEKYNYIINHLPKDAYLRTLSGHKIASILKENGFKINELEVA